MANTVLGINGSGTHAARPAGNAVPDGSLYSCSTHNLVYQSNYAGNSWATWANLAGTGFSNPMTNKGELIQGDTAGAASALAVGTLNQYLASGGAGAFNTWRAIPASLAATNRVTTDETLTGNNSFVDLATAGPAVTVTTSTLALVTVSAEVNFSATNGAYGAMSFAVSSATTIAASRANSMITSSGASGTTGTDEAQSRTFLVTLTAGSNVFTAKYNQLGGAGTTHWINRDIIVVPVN